jgi:tetratricopeptide (TPR) repeat protein
LNKTAEADTVMKMALENATAIEMHQYGRQLQSQKKYSEALVVFEKNYKKYKGAWPTNVGMMRGYSGVGDYKKALEYAKAAVPQAPDEQNKKNLEQAVKTLSEGKPVN